MISEHLLFSVRTVFILFCASWSLLEK